MKTILHALLCTSLTISSYAGPFGIESGMSMKDLEALGFTLNQFVPATDLYRVDKSKLPDDLAKKLSEWTFIDIKINGKYGVTFFRLMYKYDTKKSAIGERRNTGLYDKYKNALPLKYEVIKDEETALDALNMVLSVTRFKHKTEEGKIFEVVIMRDLRRYSATSLEESTYLGYEFENYPKHHKETQMRIQQEAEQEAEENRRRLDKEKKKLSEDL